MSYPNHISRERAVKGTRFNVQRLGRERNAHTESFFVGALASLRHCARVSLQEKLAVPLFGSLVMLVSACALRPMQTEAPRIYFLNPEISRNNPHSAAERRTAAVLLISQPRAQAGFDTEGMAYLLRPYEINYYAFSHWADTPARLLHRLLVENLDKSGLWSAVLQTPSAVPAHYRLDCDNVVLEQQFFSDPSRARLALRAQLVETQTQRIVASRYFEFFEAAESEDAYGGVQAANRAAAKLIMEMNGWLEKVYVYRNDK